MYLYGQNVAGNATGTFWRWVTSYVNDLYYLVYDSDNTQMRIIRLYCANFIEVAVNTWWHARILASSWHHPLVRNYNYDVPSCTDVQTSFTRSHCDKSDRGAIRPQSPNTCIVFHFGASNQWSVIITPYDVYAKLVFDTVTAKISRLFF